MKKILVIKNEIAELNRLRLFVESIGKELDLDDDLVLKLNLVLEEAVSNIIYYAYAEQSGQEIMIQAELDNETLIFTLSDSGKPFDPTQVAEADITLPAEERAIGGLGVFLIRQIMNGVEYQRINDRNVFILKRELNN